MIPQYKSSNHFSQILSRLSADMIISECCGLLKVYEEERELKYDTLAFCGLSGAVLAPIIAHRLGKDLLLVRKHGGKDDSASGREFPVEGNVGAERIVVVDDLIYTGATMSNIVRGIRKHTEAKIVGLLLYADDLGEEIGSSLPEVDFSLPGDTNFTKMISSANYYKEEECDSTAKTLTGTSQETMVKTSSPTTVGYRFRKSRTQPTTARK